jgi:hypothetical protein
MKKVIQCTCVDFCENIRSQDMYVKCPNIQSTYIVICDVYMYMGTTRDTPQMSQKFTFNSK